MKVVDFNALIKELGLEKKEFAEKTGMNYSGVCSWHDEKRPIPSWVDSWLENYKKGKKFDTIKELVKDEV
jgi:predicted transcriptional regulator